MLMPLRHKRQSLNRPVDMLVHSTIIEQMKLLQLFWTSGDPILTSDDSSLDALQVRMKQRYVHLVGITAGSTC